MQTPTKLELLKAAHLKRIERIVCSGGGAKGIVYAGAYQALNETGVFNSVQALLGTSAGAITSTMLALGIEPQTFRSILLSTNLKELMGETVGLSKVHLSAGVSVLTKDGLLLEQFIRTHIIATVKKSVDSIPLDKKEGTRTKNFLLKLEQESPVITFGDLALLHQLAPECFKQLTITAVEFPSGTPCIFNSTLTPDVEIALACRASASIPICLAPVSIEIDGVKKQFVDGGLYNNIPTEYFDQNPDGSFVNSKPEQTLVFAFGEGISNKNNQVFQALYGPRWDEVMEDENLRPVLYKAGALEQFSRNTLVHVLGGMNAPYKNTEQKEKGFQKLRTAYALRTVELRVGEIKTTHFEKATKMARIMDALGYLDTTNYIINHDLYNPKVFSVDNFYHDLLIFFKTIYQATLVGANENIKNDKLISALTVLEMDLKNKAFSQEQVAQHGVQLIKDNVERHLLSAQAFALSRAVEYRNGYLNEEQLFKEVYEEGFKRSTRFFAQSNATGSTIHRTHTLHEVLEQSNMFDVYFNQPAGFTKTRMNNVLDSLKDIFAQHPNQQRIESYLSSRAYFKLNLEILTPYKSKNERQVYQYGSTLLTHLDELIGTHPQMMKPQQLVDLTVMLCCAADILVHLKNNDKEQVKKSASLLSAHAQKIADADSSWQNLALDVLKFAYAVLLHISLLVSNVLTGRNVLGAISLSASRLASRSDLNAFNPEKKLKKDIYHFKMAVMLLAEEDNKEEPNSNESPSI